MRGKGMERHIEERIKVTLTAAIQNWLDTDDTGDRGEFPYLGDSIAEIMAEAALQVLRGMADAQTYLENEGMLTR
jgi:hypothetical protein